MFGNGFWLVVMRNTKNKFRIYCFSMDFYESVENSFSSNCFKSMRLFANRSIAVTESTNHTIFGKDVVQVNIELYTISALNCNKFMLL